MRSLPDLSPTWQAISEAVDPWAWAYSNEIRLVGAKFAFDGHEFQREPMQADTRTVTVRKATQMAFTEGAVLKVLHAMIHRRWPKGCLYLFPTQDTVTDFSSSRFGPLIRDNPESIGQFVRDTNRVNLKRVGDGFLYFRSGRLSQDIQGQQKTSAGLMSVPADHAVHDEYDLMSQKIDELVDGRLAKSEIKTKTFLSNPSLPDYAISAKFDESDQRYWFARCDHCGHDTCFDDPDLTEEELFTKRIIEQLNGTVIRACSHCGRNVNVSMGRWVPRRPDVQDHAGFTIGHPSASWIDPAALLREFRQTRDLGNFIRIKLGRPYVEAENRLSVAEILACCGNEGIKDWESDPCFMGVDQGGSQRDLLHVVIGKKRTEGAQYVHLGVYRGWFELDRLMKLFNVSRCVVDGLPNQDDARKFAAKHKPRVFLSYFSDTQKGSYRWDEGQMIVNSNRTEALDASHKEIQGKQIVLPRQDLDVVQTFARHCNAIAKRLDEDEETGSKRYIYIKLGSKPDHFRLANCYEAMARNDAPNWLFPEVQ